MGFFFYFRKLPVLMNDVKSEDIISVDLYEVEGGLDLIILSRSFLLGYVCNFNSSSVIYSSQKLLTNYNFCVKKVYRHLCFMHITANSGWQLYYNIFSFSLNCDFMWALSASTKWFSCVPRIEGMVGRIMLHAVTIKLQDTIRMYLSLLVPYFFVEGIEKLVSQYDKWIKGF